MHEVAGNEYDGAEVDTTDDSAEDVEDAQDVVDRAFASFLLLRIRSSWASSALSNGLLCSRQQRKLATISPLFSWRALLFIFLIGRWLRIFPVQALVVVGRLVVRCD